MDVRTVFRRMLRNGLKDFPGLFFTRFSGNPQVGKRTIETKINGMDGYLPERGILIVTAD